MDTSLTEPPSAALQVRFATKAAPTLTAGAYTLCLEQTLTFTSGRPSERLPSADQVIEVAAPRFALAADQVVALHPPPGAAADFGCTLPHMTLRGSVAWARDPFGDKSTPWLALLVLTDDDVRPDADKGELLAARTVADLVPSAPPQGVLLPALKGTVSEQEKKQACTTVDVRYKKLTAMLPLRGELPYLTHVRQVQVKRSARQAGWEPGRYGVVLANRFPRTAGPYTACLVSLEGFTDSLFGSGPKTPPDVVRMVVLHSFRFTADPSGGASFDDLARLLEEDVSTDGLLRLPRRTNWTAPTPLEAHVRERLERGYAPVTYQLPGGPHTPAWYRGPLTAVATPAVPAHAQTRPPDSALVFLRDQGVYDVSYACAYTLGRVLAMARPRLVRRLHAYRGAGLDAVHRAGRAAPAGVRGGPAAGDSKAWERVEDLVVNHGIAQKITKGLNKKRNTSPGGAEPLGSVPAQPPVSAQEVIAALVAGEETVQAQSAAEAVAQVACQHAGPIAEDIRALDWLAEVPWEYLVPHERMLPEHSARFFYLDWQWLRTLVRGALSVGVVSALEAFLAQALEAAVEQPGPSPGAVAATGCLIRSPLVSAWPDLVIEAYTTDDKGGEVPMPVVTSRPLPGVLCLLFPDRLPSRLVLREPPQGLCMGINSRSTLRLRAPVPLPEQKKEMGDLLEQMLNDLEESMRKDHQEVLRINDGRPGSLVDKLTKAYAEAGVRGHTVSAASVALQLVRASGWLEFNNLRVEPAPGHSGTPSAQGAHR
ncbi:hypothetical protein H8N00_26695 [Streptomyces sp. AC563]|uniref:hypothetical protein n=1 Tax=Streptomyces buecherae TaxID=2763006 RepID=UPI00164D0B79|nr:hypothetical protein [Streptomyces buecherae]MBC3992400.1 hypothetical protein [Streptomyces buecherae]